MLVRNLRSAVGLIVTLHLLAAGRAAQESPFSPWASGERLTYELLWPSGLILGEATLQASFSEGVARFEAKAEASLPDRRVSYAFSSVATSDLCSVRFHQRVQEGNDNFEELYEFDRQNRQVRKTRGGQTTLSSAPECARDPLTFLYYLRRQIALGKVPDRESIHMAASFPLRISVLSADTVQVGPHQWTGNHYRINYTTLRGNGFVDVWLRPDSTWVPVGAQAPFLLGTFSARLQ